MSTRASLDGRQDAASDPVTSVTPIDDTLRGLLITPDRKGEPLRLTFNAQGELVYYMLLDDRGEYWEHKSLFYTTQSRGVETHLAICEFFHLIQDNYMPGLNVYRRRRLF